MNAWIEEQPEIIPRMFPPNKELLKAQGSRNLVPAPNFGPHIQRLDPMGLGRVAENAPTSFPILHEEIGDLLLFDVQALLEKDVQEIRESVESTPHTESWHLPVVDFFLDVHPRTIIPNHLITGPWDKEKIERLVWLRRGGAVLHESQSWEVSRERSGSNLIIPY